MTTTHNRDSEPRVHEYRARSAYDVAESEDSYKGLRVSALPGLHSRVVQELAAISAAGARVLDVAAGTGAMSQRLLDSGFRVEAIEYVEENFALHGSVPCYSIDLNEDFAARVEDRFDAIVAMEIIEHLENPRAFLRGLRQLLVPGGKILLTTPNVDNPVSKALYIRYGHFLWFEDTNVEKLGHITPIGPRLLRQACADSGLRVDRMMSFGDPFRRVERWYTMRGLATLLKWFGGRSVEVRGEIIVAVLSAAD